MSVRNGTFVYTIRPGPDRLPLLVGGFVSFFTDAASNEGSGIDGSGGMTGGGTTAAGEDAAAPAGLAMITVWGVGDAGGGAGV